MWVDLVETNLTTIFTLNKKEKALQLNLARIHLLNIQHSF